MDRRRFLKLSGSLAIGAAFLTVVGNGLWQMFTHPERLFYGSKRGKGSIISADSKLFIYDERRGFVGLVNPDPTKFDVVSKFRVAKGSGPHWAHMAIDNGILYLRHGELLAAYKIK